MMPPTEERAIYRTLATATCGICAALFAVLTMAHHDGWALLAISASCVASLIGGQHRA